MLELVERQELEKIVEIVDRVELAAVREIIASRDGRDMVETAEMVIK